MSFKKTKTYQGKPNMPGGAFLTANRNTFTVTDNRTGKAYEVPVDESGSIKATDLRRIKVNAEDFGTMYVP